jgi:hypothetical protein
MTDKISDIDMNVRDIARNVLEPISFHPFDKQNNSTVLLPFID